MKKRSNGGKNREDGNFNGMNDREESGPNEKMNTPLHRVFLEEIGDIYNAEQQLLKALPRMAKAAQAEDLREAFEQHLEETEGQVTRLEEAVEALGETLERKKCKAMEGLIAEAAELMEEHQGEASLDAVLIAAAQKVEHYEIASYGTLAAWARRMGHTEAADIFEESLDEERAADDKLTDIAETIANEEAQAAD